MGLSITPNFSKRDIQKIVQKKVDQLNAAILSRLQFVGEQFVVNARDHGTYTDHTGNLRSSVGYVIFKDGEQMDENFEKSIKGSDKETGLNVGKAAAQRAVLNFPRGYVLICVAGMDYAAAVESKGKDVITASSQIAEESLKKALTRLKEKIDV